MPTKKLLLVFFLFLVVNSMAVAQSKKPPAKPRPTTAPKPTATPKETSPNSESSTQVKLPKGAVKGLVPDDQLFSDKPFDAKNFDWTKVPGDFYGNDFRKISTLLIMGTFKGKDEFETTEAYEKRVREGQEKPMFGSLTPKSSMAFFSEQVESSYNADKQVLTVNIDVRSLTFVEDNKINSSLKGLKVLKTEIKDLGVYEGQNAFGAKKAITKSELRNFLFGFDNYREFREFFKAQGEKYSVEYIMAGDDLAIDLNLPPEQARDAKQNLGIMLIVSLSKPFAGIDVDRVEPKFDRPYDITDYKHFLAGRLEQIWLFNRVTGEIYKKIIPTAITSGTLKISSPVRNDGLLLLDKSMTDILMQSGAIPIEKTKAGGVYDYLNTFIKASRKMEKKYQAFMDIVLPEIRKHTVYTIRTESYGDAKVQNLKFGNYYLFGGWSDYFGTYIWDVPIVMKDEEQSVSISTYTATYK